MIGAVLAKRGVAEGYRAMNRRDLRALMADWHDDAVFTYSGDVAGSGTFEGKGVIEDWFRRYFEWFPEVRFEAHDVCVGNLFDLVGNNVIIGHWDVQVTSREGQTGGWSGVLPSAPLSAGALLSGTSRFSTVSLSPDLPFSTDPILLGGGAAGCFHLTHLFAPGFDEMKDAQ